VAAKHIAPKHRSSLTNGFQVWIVGVQRIIAEILIHAAVKQVGAALSRDLHAAAARAGSVFPCLAFGIDLL